MCLARIFRIAEGHWIERLCLSTRSDLHISQHSCFDVRCPSNVCSCKHGTRSPGLSLKKVRVADLSEHFLLWAHRSA